MLTAEPGPLDELGEARIPAAMALSHASFDGGATGRLSRGAASGGCSPSARRPAGSGVSSGAPAWRRLLGTLTRLRRCESAHMWEAFALERRRLVRTLERNVLFNWVRETQDHGPINTWDRQTYVQPHGGLYPSCWHSRSPVLSVSAWRRSQADAAEALEP